MLRSNEDLRNPFASLHEPIINQDDSIPQAFHTVTEKINFDVKPDNVHLSSWLEKRKISHVTDEPNSDVKGEIVRSVTVPMKK
ncbi:Hypothetical protein NTJ_10585 [Nesidiocoris tenuis]|uniref:Uncharacterized protein n=1 Tax=Nesidiocoris tenuis TaxID=355587 RepID=A0ABN7B3N2_9HEMI|nr:Hypothetical protein NTJ_10585 [Nesidiocoris tenuis]